MTDVPRPDPSGLSAEEREILEFLLEQEAAAQAPVESIPRLEDRTDPPLSFAQERLWVVEQLDPESSAYNVPVVVGLSGRLAIGALEQALSEIVRRHEPLRTTFTALAGTPRQAIDQPRPVRMRLVDLSGLSADDQNELGDRFAAQETARAFDLGHDLLLRSALIRSGERDHRVVTTLHHVASDGWSLGVMSRELGALYEAYAGGAASRLEELRAQYADYAAWHRSELSGTALEAQAEYWRARLKGAPEVLTLPLDRSRPTEPTNVGGLATFDVSGRVTESLERLGRDADVTLFMTLFAAFEVLLHRYTGEVDLCVGTDVANRTHPDTEVMIGFFVNQLVVRSDLSGDPTVRELLGRVRETMLEAYAHADLPFEQLVKLVNPDRERGVTPLFQVKLVLNNTPMEAFELEGLKLEPMEAEVGGAKFDVLLNMMRTPEGLRGSLEYSTDLYDADTIERVTGHFERLLEAMVASPDARIGSLAMLTEGERSELIEKFNATAAPAYGRDRGLADRFEAEASRSPDAPALLSDGAVVTYGALNERANRLAHALRARGVGPDVMVGVYVERSVEMVVGLLGVVKAGGAYVPLDPSYPASRLSYVVEDADPAVVLTTDALADDLGVEESRVLRLDGEWAPEVAAQRSENPARATRPESLVYVIYTSGSTGQPKGTMITQGGLSNYLEWATTYYGLSTGGPSVLHSPLGFDLTVTSLWGPLTVGQPVRLLTADAEIDDLGTDLMGDEASCVLKVTPSHLSVLSQQVEAGTAGDLSRVLIVGGDQLTGEVTSEWQTNAPAMRIVNEYGPTETVVGCCIHEMEAGRVYEGAVPIGRPIANTQLYVLDAGGGLVAPGVSGELYIGGAGVARGYLSRADLTAERFVPDEYGREPGRRRYRTGDLVRLRKDGDLEYQGRVDHQVKIRGYRIELGEIEVVLGQHAAVDQVAVVVRTDDESGAKQLVAYLEADEGAVGVSALREHLLERLPEYMVPSTFVVLAALPLTANGKVDRRALPDPEGARLEVETGYAAPRTDVERTLAALWAEFLELDEVGIHDNFFELGGDSIQSLQIVARCIGEGLMLTSQQLFEHPTIAGLAGLLGDGAGEDGEDAESSGAGDDDTAAVPPIVPVERTGPLPLSFAQERLWFLDQLEPGSDAYNIPAAVRMVGPLDVTALEQTFTEIVRRHEVLRTTFSTGAESPAQVIAPAGVFSLDLVDLAHFSRDAHQPACRRLALEHARTPFDLAKGPLLRATLLRLGPKEHVALFAMHHVVSDGWSMGILIEELSQVYEAYSQGTASGLPELEVQYADFSAWQRSWFTGEVLQRQLDYWSTALAAAPPSLELPTDRPRPPLQTFRGARASFTISSEVTAALKALSQASGATIFMSLLAAFHVLLHRWAGREDILVGSPIAGREKRETQDLIGFFVNTLVLRGRVRPDATFRELLAETRDVAGQAYAHQDLPFEKLVDELNIERDLSRSPLFQVMFVFENAPERSWTASGVTMEPFATDSEIAKFDLMLDMSEAGDGLKAAFEYNTDLFDASTMERMVTHFERLLGAVTSAPDRPIGELSILPPDEATRLLGEWNDTTEPYEHEGPVHRLVEAQVGRSPDAVAIVTSEDQLTYRELNGRANQLARYLRGLGVGPEVRVGLCLDRSAEMLIGLLAIMKSGGTYVAIDPEYPPTRVAFIIGDSDAAVMLTDTAILGRLPEHGGVTVCLDEDAGAIGELSDADLASWGRQTFLSHVIYTSGSTGLPKGVAIEHRSVTTLVQWSREHYTDHELSGVLAGTSVCFDLSVWEMFVPLSCGGTIVLGENALALPKLAAKHRVTLINTVPSAITELIRQDGVPASVHTVNLAGEPLTTRLSDAIYALGTVRRVCDLYGPSEDTTYSTYAQREPGGVATIGRPLANTRAYLRSAAVEPTPIGVPGDLHLGGHGLARGYLARPALTAERFLPDPYGAEAGARVYRTGDLVRWLPDGMMEFLGRIDHQVKIRGFRIELGEIEVVLATYPGVQDVVVIARDDARGRPRLVAYVTGAETRPVESALRAHAQEELPGYMVPSAIVVLDALPLTPNGKVDRSKLPEPEDAGGPATSDFVAPHTEVEEALAAIWCDVLGVERVGMHDNFFQLGGDSILSIQIVSRANRAGLLLSPKQLFGYQTIAQLATVVGSVAGVEAEQGEVTGSAPLVPIQEWFFEHDYEDAHHYNQAVLLTAEESLDVAHLDRAVKALVSHHDALRLRFERGAGGWTQVGSEVVAGASVAEVDLSDRADGDLQAAFEATLADLQGSFDLVDGPVFGVAHITSGPGRPAHLLIVAHHLVVDGVSWRILLEDLQEAFGQVVRGEAVVLPPKTTAYTHWATAWREHGRSLAEVADAGYWLDPARRSVAALPVDRPGGENTVASRRTVTVSLDAEETAALLHEVPAAYGTKADEAILAATVHAFRGWTGDRRLLVDLEGHGRDADLEGVDLSRTVGWCTALYPVHLEAPGVDDLATRIKSIKEQLRSVPSRGLEYGLLRYADAGDVADRLAAMPKAQVTFNYLGQFDQTLSSDSPFQWAADSPGPVQSPRARHSHLLDVGGVVAEGRLRLTFQYSEEVHELETIERLAEATAGSLRELIEHCRSPEAGGHTPSDFPLARVDQDTLDRVLGEDRRVEDVYPLSAMQKGLLFHTLTDPGSGVYFEQLSCRIEGHLDVDAFLGAWQSVASRHAILRTAISVADPEAPLQVVLHDAEVPWDLLDWSDLSEAQSEEALSTYLEADRKRGFDLRRAPLMRMALARLQDGNHRLVWSFHHLLLDGWSLPLILGEVFNFYDAAIRGKTAVLPPARSYREYIGWLESRSLEAAEEYWRGTLAGFTAPTPLSLEGAVATSGAGPGSYAKFEVELDEETTDRLRSWSRADRITLNTIVQGAWALLLSRYTGEDDVVFGATVSGRPADVPDVESIVGLFINTLPVRVGVDEQSTVVEWLRSLQERQAEARAFEHTPLVKIQGWSEVPAGLPLFQSLFVFENYPIDEALEDRDTEIAISDVRAIETTNYPVMLTVGPARRMMLRIGYEQQRFDTRAIQRMVHHLATLLGKMVDAPERPLEEVALVTEGERLRLLDEWSGSQADYPAGASLQSLFEIQAARTPDRIAITGRDGCVSFAELDHKANRLARHLQSLEVGPEDLVGVFMERSLESVVTLMAIVKTGGAYLPLDPKYPRERIAFMLRDAAPTVVVTRSAIADEVPQSESRILDIDAEADEIARWSGVDLAPQAGGDRLAYSIYTSGSTGIPKGVQARHGATVNRLSWMWDTYPFDERDVCCHKTALSFVDSVWEIFGPLLQGVTVVVIPDEDVEHPSRLVEAFATHSVSRVSLVPSLLDVLVTTHSDLSGVLPNLRQIVTSGEALPPELAHRFHQANDSCALVNLYGSSEVAADVTFADLKDGDPVVIGRPITNARTYLVDARSQPVPIGVPGELLIGGAGLARGYLGRPDLTAERFLPDLFGKTEGGRVFRSGDLGCFHEDGSIEFLGRRDHQVKIRGFRVELGEIEAALSDVEGVRHAVVLAREDHPQPKRLVAYVVADEGGEVSVSELREAVSRRLPGYMVPAVFVHLDELPLTPNGKTDRAALPAPDAQRPDLQSPFVAPRNPLEERLASTWTELLHVEQVGVHDDFFQLGGDSIVAMQIVFKARQDDLYFTPRQLFEHPTVGGLAQALRANGAGQDDEHGTLPLTAGQRQVLEDRDGAGKEAVDVFELAVTRAVDPEAMGRAVDELVARHDALRLRARDGAQSFEGPPAAALFHSIDLTGLSEVEQRSQLVGLTSTAREHLDPPAGVVVQVLHFELGGGPSRVVVCLHRLGVDEASERLVLEDLQALLELVVGRGDLTSLPAAGSYRRWASRHAAAAEVPARSQAYWSDDRRGSVPPLPLDRPDGVDSEEPHVEVSLDAANTAFLLTEVPDVYGTRTEEVLLAALAVALARWSGEARLLVDLEVDASDSGDGDPGGNRMVGARGGWYPALIETVLGDDPGGALRGVKDQVRAAPDGGFSYLRLRYPAETTESSRGLERFPAPQVSFRYDGDEDIGSKQRILASPGQDAWIDPPSPGPARIISVHAGVRFGELRIELAFRGGVLADATQTRIVEGFLGSLDEILRHCRSAEAGGVTPSDFPLSQLDQRSLDQLFGDDE